MIEIKNLHKEFELPDGGVHHVLKDINVTIETGSIFGIIGQSGAGKSTLVRCINLLERPTSGNIIIDGRDVTGLSGRELLEFRSTVGMIFQNFSLFQQRTVLHNVTFPLELHGVKKRDAEEHAVELLARVGLAGNEKKYPSQLSGGQQQRVAIARALINQPSIMLCDEATSALDTMTTIQILDLLKSINEEMGVTLVLITHSLQVAERICDNIIVVDDGVIVEQGRTHDVFTNPQSDIAKALLGRR